MIDKHDITPELLRQLLCYEPETGKLFWLSRSRDYFTSEGQCKSWNTRFVGKEAVTSINKHGYNHGQIFARNYSAHRVAWAMHYGAWPDGQIDHINHDKLDNRINNLRVVTNKENNRNRGRATNNTSGHTGVSWHKRDQKWLASIVVDDKKKNLGRFDSKDDAIAARANASRLLGFHQNHGQTVVTP